MRETKYEVTSRDIAQIQHVIVLSVVFCLGYWFENLRLDGEVLHFERLPTYLKFARSVLGWLAGW